MQIKFDFRLNPFRYSVVDRLIFKLVIRGLDCAPLISQLLWIFSPEVKATAIQNLVNHQLLRFNLESQGLYISEIISALITSCHSQEFRDEDITFKLEPNKIIEDPETIKNVLNLLLPKVKTDFLKRELNFVVRSVNT